MPTSEVQIVDTDSSATRDYASMSLWEAQNRDLITEGVDLKLICRASSGVEDTTFVNVSGWLTNSANSVTITCDEDHGGGWNDNNYVLSSTLSYVWREVATLDHFRVHNIQFAKDGGSGSIAPIVYWGTAQAGDYGEFDGCTFYNTNTGRGDIGNRCNSLGAGGYYVVRNCVSIGCLRGFATDVNHTNEVYWYNNTAIDCTEGFRANDSASSVLHRVKNNAAINCGTGYVEGVGVYDLPNCENNYSEDGTAPGKNPISGDAIIKGGVDEAGELSFVPVNVASNPLINRGKNLHADSHISTKRDRTGRRVASTAFGNVPHPHTIDWDVGAYQVSQFEVNIARLFVAAAGGSTARITALDSIITYDLKTGRITAVDSVITYDPKIGRITATDAVLTFSEKLARITAVDSTLTFDEKLARIAAVDSILTYDPKVSRITAVDSVLTHSLKTGRITAVDSILTFVAQASRISAVDALLTYGTKMSRITAMDSILTHSLKTGHISAVDSVLTFSPKISRITALDSTLTFDQKAARLTALDAELTYLVKTGRITAVDAALTFIAQGARITALDALLTYTETEVADDTPVLVAKSSRLLVQSLKKGEFLRRTKLR